MPSDGDKMTGIKIEETKDAIIIKIDKSILSYIKDIKPENDADDLKQLIDGRETIIKRSLLQVYFDRDLINDIKYKLAKLLVYYSLEGKRYDRKSDKS